MIGASLFQKSKSMIVGIEFDQSVFTNSVKCEKWLRSNFEYQGILLNKKWKLLSIAKSRWMSSEGRKVFAWYGATYYCHEIKLERPDPYVLIFRQIGNNFYSDNELPPLTQKFQRKLRETELKREIRDQQKLENDEKRKAKKRQKRKMAEKDIGKAFEVNNNKRKRVKKEKSYEKGTLIQGEILTIPQDSIMDPLIPELDTFATRVDNVGSRVDVDIVK